MALLSFILSNFSILMALSFSAKRLINWAIKSFTMYIPLAAPPSKKKKKKKTSIEKTLKICTVSKWPVTTLQKLLAGFML